MVLEVRVLGKPYYRLLMEVMFVVYFVDDDPIACLWKLFLAKTAITFMVSNRSVFDVIGC